MRHVLLSLVLLGLIAPAAAEDTAPAGLHRAAAPAAEPAPSLSQQERVRAGVERAIGACVVQGAALQAQIAELQERVAAAEKHVVEAEAKLQALEKPAESK